LNPITAIPA
jgi:hypothetical protein